MSYNDEDRKGILKGQCLNIAFNGFNPLSSNTTKKEIELRIEYAHDIFNELMRQKFLIW